MSDSTNVLLWADTQVGKTAYLTTALCRSGQGQRPRHIDPGKSAASLAQTLLPNWRRLRRGLYVAPTSEEVIDLELISRGGTAVCLRDIKGQLTREIHRATVAERLDQAHAVLFLVEWGSRSLNDQMLAIESALDFCGGKPIALAFTKCELGLAEDHEAWSALRNEGWWQREANWSEHAAVLTRFGASIWPTSAYGYDPRTGLPAAILGEFGQLIPYRVSPKGVLSPLEWIFDRLGVAE
jgi:hypothetical protein